MRAAAVCGHQRWHGSRVSCIYLASAHLHSGASEGTSGHGLESQGDGDDDGEEGEAEHGQESGEMSNSGFCQASSLSS